MAVRAVFEADTPRELLELLRTIASGRQQAEANGPDDERLSNEPAPLRVSYAEFKRRRPDIAQQILTVVEQAGGRLNLRELERRVGRSGPSMAGTLGALTHAANSTYGAAILLPQPWFSIDDGPGWDREYILNPDIYRPES
jgi:hypothetical protein